MPSIPSQLFNPITGRAMESLFKDFDVERARSLLARVDGLNPAPTGVVIEPLELAHCSAEWIRTGRRIALTVAYLKDLAVAFVFANPVSEHRDLISHIHPHRVPPSGFNELLAPSIEGARAAIVQEPFDLSDVTT